MKIPFKAEQCHFFLLYFESALPSDTLSYLEISQPQVMLQICVSEQGLHAKQESIL